MPNPNDARGSQGGPRQPGAEPPPSQHPTKQTGVGQVKRDPKLQEQAGDPAARQAIPHAAANPIPAPPEQPSRGTMDMSRRGVRTNPAKDPAADGRSPLPGGQQDQSRSANAEDVMKSGATGSSFGGGVRTANVGNMPLNPQNRRLAGDNRPMSAVDADPAQPGPENNPNMQSGEDDPGAVPRRMPGVRRDQPMEAPLRRNADPATMRDPAAAPEDGEPQTFMLEMRSDGRSNIMDFIGQLIANGKFSAAVRLGTMWFSPDGVTLKAFQTELYSALGILKDTGEVVPPPRGAQDLTVQDLDDEEKGQLAQDMRKAMQDQGVDPARVAPDLWSFLVPLAVKYGIPFLEMLFTKIFHVQQATPNRNATSRDMMSVEDVDPNSDHDPDGGEMGNAARKGMRKKTQDEADEEDE